ncbi:MAG TPA: BatA domain-containing protein [Cyclobacteriaceae bacterium]|nr:BatA domain-containing protein [Cyclobacteriaceae bacterium]
MTFANPSYLWAFAGLAIPLAIHLLSRKEGKVIRVGSLRHVEESNTSQFKSIRLNEILLLLLRSLMITMLVFFLSGAQCTNPPGAGEVRWLVVEAGIGEDPDYRPQIDSLTSAGYDLHEFPKGDYWTVAEQLGRLPHEVVVISYSRVEGYNGERIRLPENIRWISAEQSPKEFQAMAWQAGDSVFVRTARSGSLLTSYRTGFGVPDSIEIIKPGRITINISADDKSEADILMAALNVLKSEYKLPIEISNTQSQSPMTNAWTFWLREAKPKFSGDQQVVLSTPCTGPLIERISGNVLHLNRKLDQDVALNENLVIELFKILYPDLDTPNVSKQKDIRSMPDGLAWSDGETKNTGGNVPSRAGIEKYLILLFVLSLATERFVAIRRNQ